MSATPSVNLAETPPVLKKWQVRKLLVEI